MTQLQCPAPQVAEPAEADGCPSEVEFILSALEAATPQPTNRRRHGRMRYHVQAKLYLFVDPSDAPARILYTRDASERGLGFITQARLPLGYGGRVQLPGPQQQRLTIDCTLLRCHEAVPGWFEGSLYFNRQQWAFEAE